jgi:hypothetical protein
MQTPLRKNGIVLRTEMKKAFALRSFWKKDLHSSAVDVMVMAESWLIMSFDSLYSLNFCVFIFSGSSKL